MPTPRNSSLPIPLPKILSSPTNTHNPGLPQMPSQRSPLLPVLVHPSGSVPSFGELPRALHNENWSESFISRKSVVFPTAVGLPGGLRVQTGGGFGAILGGRVHAPQHGAVSAPTEPLSPHTDIR